MIVAGQGILYAEAWDELLALAELTQTPVMTTLNGKSAFPENHALALGCAGGSRRGEAIHFLDRADLILGLGTSFTRSEYITPFPTEGRIFAQLTNWEGDVSKDYPVDLGVIGDAKPSLAAMAADVVSPARRGRPRGRDGGPGRGRGRAPDLHGPVGAAGGVRRDARQPLSRDRGDRESRRPAQDGRHPTTRARRATRPRRSTRPSRLTATWAGARPRNSVWVSA